eukprot:m.167150 g.167150  ORF g.167150 m.167150 type:complete len:62 (+) comp12784_c0_seq1:524-709(+)
MLTVTVSTLVGEHLVSHVTSCHSGMGRWRWRPMITHGTVDLRDMVSVLGTLQKGYSNQACL